MSPLSATITVASVSQRLHNHIVHTTKASYKPNPTLPLVTLPLPSPNKKPPYFDQSTLDYLNSVRVGATSLIHIKIISTHPSLTSVLNATPLLTLSLTCFNAPPIPPILPLKTFGTARSRRRLLLTCRPRRYGSNNNNSNSLVKKYQRY